MTENYQAKKFADVLCTEDRDTRLVMLPINQALLWAKTEGEIRPVGRNPYAVWTPNALQHFLAKKGAPLSANASEGEAMNGLLPGDRAVRSEFGIIRLMKVLVAVILLPLVALGVTVSPLPFDAALLSEATTNIW